MTLTAIDSKTGEYISSEGIADLKQHFGIDRVKHFCCPITNAPVVPVKEHERGSSEVSSHFRVVGGVHWPDDILKDREYVISTVKGDRLGESPDHQRAKLYVKNHACDWDDDFNPDLARLEYKLHLPTRKAYRIADVAFIYPDGDVYVHEVQLAQISPNELEERTQDYLDGGFGVVWWFGNEANTAANIHWHKTFLHIDPGILKFELAEA